MYAASAACVWPVLAFYLLRIATPATQYRQLGIAAGLAALWPLLVVLTAVGLVVRALRPGRNPHPDDAVSQAPTKV